MAPFVRFTMIPVVPAYSKIWLVQYFETLVVSGYRGLRGDC
jgi:hypothetical protein